MQKNVTDHNLLFHVTDSRKGRRGRFDHSPEKKKKESQSPRSLEQNKKESPRNTQEQNKKESPLKREPRESPKRANIERVEPRIEQNIIEQRKPVDQRSIYRSKADSRTLDPRYVVRDTDSQIRDMSPKKMDYLEKKYGIKTLVHSKSKNVYPFNNQHNPSISEKATESIETYKTQLTNGEQFIESIIPGNKNDFVSDASTESLGDIVSGSGTAIVLETVHEQCAGSGTTIVLETVHEQCVVSMTPPDIEITTVSPRKEHVDLPIESEVVVLETETEKVVIDENIDISVKVVAVENIVGKEQECVINDIKNRADNIIKMENQASEPMEKEILPTNEQVVEEVSAAKRESSQDKVVRRKSKTDTSVDVAIVAPQRKPKRDTSVDIEEVAPRRQRREVDDESPREYIPRRHQKKEPVEVDEEPREYVPRRFQKRASEPELKKLDNSPVESLVQPEEMPVRIPINRKQEDPQAQLLMSRRNAESMCVRSGQVESIAPSAGQEFPKLSLDVISISLKVVGDLPKPEEWTYSSPAKLLVIDYTHLAVDKSRFQSISRYGAGQGREFIFCFLEHMYSELSRNIDSVLDEIESGINVDENLLILSNVIKKLAVFLHNYESMRFVYKDDSSMHAKLGNNRDRYHNFYNNFFRKVILK